MGRSACRRVKRRDALKLAARASAALACAVLYACTGAVAAPAGVSIVPRPRLLVVNPGAYVWRRPVRISATTSGERVAAAFVQSYLHALGLRATVARPAREPADLALHVNSHRMPALGGEGYVLSVSRRGVRLVANAPAGLFYGVQTLEQASTPLPGGRLATRNVAITDWPAFGWRGLHLDVSRHFFGPSVIERYIDVAAHYKLNTFHWHLTDDQAWRIQIMRYPRLTGADACRAATCEFYTQPQIRRIVAYAARRSVRVVPEIDVPGHSSAALAAYPALACAQSVGPHVLCPTDAGVAFVKNVLTEILELFPSRYVHIGGDEVDTSEWRGSSEVAAVMRRERLVSLARVQPYFTRRIARFLRSHGRRTVGWDEIAPEAPPDVTLMLWQPQSAVFAFTGGHDVVPTPAGTLYFDAYQGDPSQEPPAFGGVTTLRDVYAYAPLPSGLPSVYRKYVLGAQANVWTERIATPQHLFYMLLPRALALAESVWSRPQDRDWDSFVRRLPAQFAWLQAHGFPFRVPNATCTVGAARRARGDLAFMLAAPLAANIRYTLDGSPPTPASRLYRGPLTVRDVRGRATRVRARVFAAGGLRSTVSECTPAGTRAAAARALPPAR